MDLMRDEDLRDTLLTRRLALCLAVPLLLPRDALCGAQREIPKTAAQDKENLKVAQSGAEQLFFTQVTVPACGIPARSGEESNLAYCHWLIGRQPFMRNSGLRLIHDVTTFAERYTKEFRLGVFHTMQIVDPNHRLRDASTCFARVRSHEPEPRAVLTAVVEEHVLVDGQDAAAIHYVTKKFVFANHEWNLVESHVSRLG